MFTAVILAYFLVSSIAALVVALLKWKEAKRIPPFECGFVGFLLVALVMVMPLLSHEMGGQKAAHSAPALEEASTAHSTAVSNNKQGKTPKAHRIPVEVVRVIKSHPVPTPTPLIKPAQNEIQPKPTVVIQQPHIPIVYTPPPKPKPKPTSVPKPKPKPTPIPTKAPVPTIEPTAILTPIPTPVPTPIPTPSIEITPRPTQQVTPGPISTLTPTPTSIITPTTTDHTPPVQITPPLIPSPTPRATVPSQTERPTPQPTPTPELAPSPPPPIATPPPTLVLPTSTSTISPSPPFGATPTPESPTSGLP